jgi:uncharacterized membrane protein
MAFFGAFSMRLHKAGLLIFFLLLQPCLSLSNISGSTHSWASLDVISQAVVEINTTPSQAFVTSKGEYSFQVPAGTYTLTAKSMRNGQVELYDKVSVTVLPGPDAAYNIDLVLFPPDYYGYSPTAAEEILGNGSGPSPSDLLFSFDEKPNFSLRFSGVLLAFAVAAALAAIFFFWKMKWKGKQRKVTEKKRAPGKKKEAKKKIVRKGIQTPTMKLEKATTNEISPDASEVILKIETAGGRINQRDLRKSLPYSEAKASLILSELEARGIIRKFKRGRGNLIVLQKPTGKL